MTDKAELSQDDVKTVETALGSVMERSKELYSVAHQESDNKVSNVASSAVGLIGSTVLSYASIYFPPAKLAAKPWVLNGIRAGAVAASAGFGYFSGSSLYKFFSGDNRE